MPFAARITDLTNHGGRSILPVVKVLIEGLPAATLGATHICSLDPVSHPLTSSPFLIPGHPKIMIAGKPALSTADACLCGAMHLSGPGAKKVILKP